MGSKKVTDAGYSAGKRDKKVIEDPRFSKVHYDPRFQNVPKHKSKVTIDSRFSSMFTDKNLNTSSSARVDKRGKVKKQSENHLRQHYHLDDEDDNEASKKSNKKLLKSDEVVDEDEKVMTKKEKKKLLKMKVKDDVEEVMTKKEKKKKLLKLKIEDEDEEQKSGEESSEESESESESMSSDSTSTDDTEDEVDGAESSGDDESVEVEDVPVIEKETHRLAVVNMDWTHVTAVDLLVMLSSWLPKGGQIKSVAVYPSEFGLKRMEEEAVRGPVALFEDDKKKGGSDSVEDDSDSDEDEGDDVEEVSDDEDDADEVSDNENADQVSNDEDGDEDDELEGSDDEGEDGYDLEDNIDNGDEDEEDDDDDEIDNEKLRAYEKSKLRYYYAVVECDSIATADYLYKACDGIEFERSSNMLDLRFIPDSMEFKHQPRDVATETPAEYEGLDFQTRALQQSNTVLSWDDDEPHRVKTLRRNFSEKQLAEMESNEYLASDESEIDGDIYHALAQSGSGSEEEDEGQNMEVTFATGLEDISKKIIEKKERGSETVFEADLRKKKEKNIAKKNKSKTSSDDETDQSDDKESGEDPDDFFEEAPSVVRSKKDPKGEKGGKGKKKKEKKTVVEQKIEASPAELELLLADENGENKKLKGYNIKKKKAKGKKGAETPDETNLPTVDYDDPRFSALLNNPRFALDPTDPQFKRSATYHRQLTERQRNNSEDPEGIEPPEPSIKKNDGNSVGSSQKDKCELSAMVKSLKMKSQQLPGQTTIKRKDTMKSDGPTSEKKHKLQGSDRVAKKAKRQK